MYNGRTNGQRGNVALDDQAVDATTYHQGDINHAEYHHRCGGGEGRVEQGVDGQSGCAQRDSAVCECAVGVVYLSKWSHECEGGWGWEEAS